VIPPLVSVIVPAYNCGRFVAEAVESALYQDYPAKEVIVVNDGSTDDTLIRLTRFGSAIRVISQKNAGPPAARNTGLREAQGSYIALLDADDVWLPGKLSAQVNYLENHAEVGTVYTAWQLWKPDTNGGFHRANVAGPATCALVVDPTRSGWLYNRLLFACELLTTTVMLRASIVRAIGEFDITMFNGDDYDYWIRASRIAQIHKLQYVGALYRVTGNSVSRKPRERNFEYEVVHRAVSQWGLVGPNGTITSEEAIRRRLNTLMFQHGYEHFHNGSPRLAWAAFRQLLKEQPMNPKLWIYTLLTIVKMVGH
jgi:glycosyltransferase involved in cell wall biosynthesis